MDTDEEKQLEKKNTAMGCRTETEDEKKKRDREREQDTRIERRGPGKRKKKKNHSSLGERRIQGRGRKVPGCRRGTTGPQAWDSPQLPLSALLEDSATSDASLSFYLPLP